MTADNVIARVRSDSRKYLRFEVPASVTICGFASKGQASNPYSESEIHRRSIIDAPKPQAIPRRARLIP